MKLWLATNKNLPPAIKAKGGQPDMSASAKVLGLTGAPATLMRACQAELASYDRMNAIDPAKDPVAHRLAHTEWLKNSVTVRQLDRSITANRRDAEFWVERDPLEQQLRTLATMMHHAVQQTAVALQDRFQLPAGSVSVIEDRFSSGMWPAIGALAAQAGVPGWMVKALSAPQTAAFRHATPAIAALSQDFKTWLESGRAQITLGIAEFRAELERLQSALANERAQDEASAVWHSSAFTAAREALVERIRSGQAQWEELRRFEDNFAKQNGLQ